MKRILILLCLPMIGFGQQLQYKLDSVTSNDSTSSISEIPYYDNQGKCTKVVQSIQYPTGSIYAELYASYYPNNQLNTATVLLSNLQSQPLDTAWVQHYVYDSNGELEQINRIGYNGHDSVITYFTYNSNKLILQESQVWDGGLWGMYDREEYNYQSGLLSSSTFYIYSSSWDTAWSKQYIHSNGNITLINKLDNYGFVTSSKQYTHNNISLTITAWPQLFPWSNRFYGCPFIGTNQVTQEIENGDITTYHYSPWSGGTSIDEIYKQRALLKVIDVLGRETKGKKNNPLFYIYDDGTVEKRIVIE